MTMKKTKELSPGEQIKELRLRVAYLEGENSRLKAAVAILSGRTEEES